MNKRRKFINKLSRKTTFKRRAFFLIFDILLISLSMYASVWSRFNGTIPEHYKKNLIYFIAMAVLIKLTFLVLFNLYDISWRFVSLDELLKIFKSLSLGSLALGMASFLLRTSIPLRDAPLPRSVLLIDFIFSFILIGALRIAKRIINEGIKNVFKTKKEIIKILIFGAGSAGEQMIREMIRNKDSKYLPVGLIDDDPAKQRIKIHGVKVLGTRMDIPRIFKNNEIDEALIAIPSAHSSDLRKIVQIMRETNVLDRIKILPSTADLIGGKITLSDIHEIELEDLLGRSSVKIDLKTIKEFVQGKKVLITGAGGSIGVELTNLTLQFDPKSVIAFDNDETEIHNLINNQKSSNEPIIPVIGDVKDETTILSVFEKYSPEIVVHSAAYKHVPILEFYPEESIKTNILGTKILAETALKYNVEKFIFISTDKAINPTSVMGASKRVGEEYLKILNQKGKTKFISVRFGNVLGSRGSVIPLFKDQIRKGGPVTVTHPEMKRYFMIISEAILLVLEASALGQGGEVFILDMGDPIKIVDLAGEMIRLSGFEPDVDIPIVFTQIRPGEKLYEEILGAEEGAEPTEYEKIFKARSVQIKNAEFLENKINLLIELSYQRDKRDEIIKILQKIVPSFRPSKYQLPLGYL